MKEIEKYEYVIIDNTDEDGFRHHSLEVSSGQMNYYAEQGYRFVGCVGERVIMERPLVEEKE